MKKLVPVDLKIEGCLDADVLGERIVDCCSQLSTDCTILNILKIHTNNMSAFPLSKLIHHIGEHIHSLGFDNTLIIPLDGHNVIDVTIDHVEVRDV